MIIFIIILSVLLLGSVAFGVTYFSRYRDADKKYSKLKEEYLFKGRKGVYVDEYLGKSYVYVQEIERYENNMSKIRFLDAEYFDGYSSDKESSLEHAKETFCSLKSADEIEWLELNVKDMRKEKLKEIENNLKNETT